MSYCNIIYREELIDLGEDNSFMINYSEIVACVKGNSGMIKKVFRADNVYVESAWEGEFENISRNKDSFGNDDNRLEIFSKFPLLENSTTSRFGNENYYMYSMEADIMNQEHFPCYYPDSRSTQDQISIQELYEDMCNFYERIFKVSPKDDNVETFKVFKN